MHSYLEAGIGILFIKMILPESSMLTSIQSGKDPGFLERGFIYIYLYICGGFTLLILSIFS